MPPRLPALLPLLLALTACHPKETPPSPPLAASTTPPARVPVTPAPSARSARPIEAAAPARPLASRVTTFFAGYKDGSDFSFLRAACASPVERFVTMKSADIDKVIASARHFFADKRAVHYAPDEQALHITHGADGDVVRVPVTMTWATLPPPEWSPDAPRREFRDAGLGDPLWGGYVVHTTTVDVELAFDGEGRITRYVEGAPRRAKLSFHADEACRDTSGIATARPDREVVTDLGEVYFTEFSGSGPQIARHVRLPDGKDAWVQDTRSYPVPNPGGGTSAGMSQCLVPVGSP